MRSRLRLQFAKRFTGGATRLEHRSLSMIPPARPDLGPEEIAAVTEVIQSGMIAGGRKVAELEERWATFCDAKHAIALSNGTVALMSIFAGLGLGPGDEVITVSHTFNATVSSILFTGSSPVFVDIEADTYLMDAGRIEAAITPRTRAICPVSLFGMVADMDAIGAIADRYGLTVVEDACQAHGALYRGRRAGSFGTAAFSLYATKNMTTGEGGFVTTNDDRLADWIRLYRNQGMRERYHHETLATPLCYPKCPGGPSMRTFFLCLIAVAAHAAVYQASVDQLTVVHGAAAADSAIHHSAPKSLRVEPGGQYPDALVRSAPVSLTIGKRYELSAWVRTDNLTVRDTDRSPIATGAALSMASIPFDVHSETLAGTRPWTRLSLKFTATRAQDAILLAVANGGAFKGKAWFEGVSLDEASSTDAWPAREAVKTFGPAWRYPAAGWIYLHIEGKPYERGYQHGYLMAREIPEYLERCAADLGTNAAGWGALRTQASALFLRGFDREILEEMRGIADGASDAGTKWQGRRLDVDIVVSNITVELGE